LAPQISFYISLSKPHTWFKHAPKLVDWIRFPVGSHRRLEKRYLQPVNPRARRWWVTSR